MKPNLCLVRLFKPGHSQEYFATKAHTSFSLELYYFSFYTRHMSLIYCRVQKLAMWLDPLSTNCFVRTKKKKDQESLNTLRQSPLLKLLRYLLDICPKIDHLVI